MKRISTFNTAKAIYETLKEKSGAELENALEMSVGFLARKNMLSKAPEILEQLQKIIDTDLGIVRAEILCKTPPSASTVDEIRRDLKLRYRAKDIAVNVKEDASLLGGIRIEANGEVLDFSLKNKFNQLQNHLLTT